MILMRNFLFVVMRKAEKVLSPNDPKASLAMNSLAYAGTMAVKNEESLKYL